MDPNEVAKNEWKDDVDLWPAVTHVHVCMYLILTPSPYSEKDMLQECRPLPELCQRLGEASSRQGSWKQENYNRQG